MANTTRNKPKNLYTQSQSSHSLYRDTKLDYREKNFTLLQNELSKKKKDSLGGPLTSRERVKEIYSEAMKEKVML